MTLETSDLNKSGALRDGTSASRKGGTGDGNAPTAEALEAGFSRVDDPDQAPRWLTSMAGMDDMADSTANSGFLGRPSGYER